MEEHMQNIKEEGGRISDEVRERAGAYILAGLGIVVGLAWNEAIKGLIEYLFPFSTGGSILAKFFYATALTLVIVLVSMYVFKKKD